MAGSTIPGPKAIIYLTRSDYFYNVPVILSADKKTLVSYPDPRDLTVNGKLCLPTRLEKEYLLDNRGITPDAAYISMSYEAYSKLLQAPSSEEIMNMIVDKNPFRRMYLGNVKSSYQDIENQLNTIITSGNLKNLKRVK